MKTILPLLRVSHASQRRLHRQERAGEVDVERPPPVGVRGAMCRSAAGHAGIRHDDVDRSARGLRLLVERRHCGFVGDVAGDGEDTTALLRDVGKRGLAPAADRHLDAGFGERKRNRPANARAAARYQRMPSHDSWGRDHTFSPAAASRSASR